MHCPSAMSRDWTLAISHFFQWEDWLNNKAQPKTKYSAQGLCTPMVTTLPSFQEYNKHMGLFVKVMLKYLAHCTKDMLSTRIICHTDDIGFSTREIHYKHSCKDCEHQAPSEILSNMVGTCWTKQQSTRDMPGILMLNRTSQYQCSSRNMKKISNFSNIFKLFQQNYNIGQKHFNIL